MRVHEVIEKSGVVFGTSGARGLVSEMTDYTCYGYTVGFLKMMLAANVWNAGDRVALAGDLRPSTPRILSACTKAVLDMGGEPIFCGFQPTPALALWAFEQGIPSLMVTGSHIPDDRNGIKFYRPDGELLKEDEPLIIRQEVAFSKSQWTAAGALLDQPPAIPLTNIGPAYVRRYVDFFGPQCLSGRRIGVYQHSAVGRDLLVDVLAALGAEVLPLGRSDQFIPVDTEAVRPEDHALARLWTKEHRMEAIASTDGDSDRPLLADENGDWIRGDILGVICARFIGAQTVVTPVSSNSMVDAMGCFRRVVRTRIGSPYVIAAMNAARDSGDGLVCGYEANGGFLLGGDVRLHDHTLKALPTRDAVLPILTALVAAGKDGLAHLVRALPQRVTASDRLPDFLPARRHQLMAWLDPADREVRTARLQAAFSGLAGAPLLHVDDTDGIRMRFSNQCVIHLRASGNAPELRCYTEADAPETATALNRAALAWVSTQFSG